MATHTLRVHLLLADAENAAFDLAQAEKAFASAERELERARCRADELSRRAAEAVDDEDRYRDE